MRVVELRLEKRTGQYNECTNVVELSNISDREVLIVAKFKDKYLGPSKFVTWSSIIDSESLKTILNVVNYLYNGNRLSKLEDFLNFVSDETEYVEEVENYKGNDYILRLERCGYYDYDGYIRLFGTILESDNKDYCSDNESYIKNGTFSVLLSVIKYLNEEEYKQLESFVSE